VAAGGNGGRVCVAQAAMKKFQVGMLFFLGANY
jgi:hypothetical protein